MVKDPGTLVAAYGDSAGITAAFDKNVLAVLNTRLGADFDLDAFEHSAVWVPETEWIEMRLRSAAEQRVRVPGAGVVVRFTAGEEMCTGICQIPPRRPDKRTGGRRARSTSLAD